MIDRSRRTVLGYFRADETARLLRLVAGCAAIFAAGAVMLSFSDRHLNRFGLSDLQSEVMEADLVLGLVLMIGGLICAVLGPLYAIAQLGRLWGRDEALLVEEKGLSVEHNSHPVWALGWDAIAKIGFDRERKQIVLSLRSGEERALDRRFGGEALAKHLEDVRRKVSFGLRAPSLSPRR